MAIKLQGILEGKETHFEETKQISESDMEGMLALSDWEFNSLIC